MSRIRIGVVGCGLIGQTMHLPHLKELHELYEVVALCDVSPGTLQYVGDYHGIARRHADYRALLKEPLDAVMVLSAIVGWLLLFTRTLAATERVDSAAADTVGHS